MEGTGQGWDRIELRATMQVGTRRPRVRDEIIMVVGTVIVH